MDDIIKIITIFIHEIIIENVLYGYITVTTGVCWTKALLAFRRQGILDEGKAQIHEKLNK